MSAPVVYLGRRRPCWYCSRSLMRLQHGEHKGKYVARVVVIDGYERHVHEQCMDQVRAGMLTGDEAADIETMLGEEAP